LTVAEIICEKEAFMSFRDHSHITYAKNHIFRSPLPLLHCVHFVDPHAYIQSCSTPPYKIVMPYQILYLVSEFQVYMQPLVKSSGVISVCAVLRTHCSLHQCLTRPTQIIGPRSTPYTLYSECTLVSFILYPWCILGVLRDQTLRNKCTTVVKA